MVIEMRELKNSQFAVIKFEQIVRLNNIFIAINLKNDPISFIASDSLAVLFISFKNGYLTIAIF